MVGGYSRDWKSSQVKSSGEVEEIHSGLLDEDEVGR